MRLGQQPPKVPDQPIHKKPDGNKDTDSKSEKVKMPPIHNEDEKSASKQELDLAKAEIKKLKKELRGNEENVIAVKQELNETKQTVTEQKNMIIELETNLKEERTKSQELENEIVSLTAKVNKMKENKTRLREIEKTLEASENNVTKLTEQLAKQEGDNRVWQESFKSIRKEKVDAFSALIESASEYARLCIRVLSEDVVQSVDFSSMKATAGKITEEIRRHTEEKEDLVANKQKSIVTALCTQITSKLSEVEGAVFKITKIGPVTENKKGK